MIPSWPWNRIGCILTSLLTTGHCLHVTSQLSYVSMYVNWWLIRVTLLVAFWFLPQNFGRWWRPTYDGFCSKINAVWVVGMLNSYLLFKEITFYTFTFYTFGQRGHNNIGCKHEYSCQGATWWNFHYLIFIYWSYCLEHYLHFWKFHLKCTQGEKWLHPVPNWIEIILQ